MTASSILVTNESATDCDGLALARLAAFLLHELRLHPECEFGITLVDEDRMSALHVEHMGEPGPTDVLSFPIDELRPASEGVDPQPGVLGDIVLCPSFAAGDADTVGRSLDEHLQFLVIHGTLHLVGYDHATPEEYDEMFALQDDLLRRWKAT